MSHLIALALVLGIGSLSPIQAATAATGVSPGAGSGMAQTFAFTFSDTGGWQNLTMVNVLINSALDGRQACYAAFAPSGSNSGSVYLVDDAGDSGGPYSGMTLPGNGTAQNSQCAIGAAGSSVSGSGNTLTLTLAVIFNPSFAGNKVVNMAARDAALNFGNSGWQALGTWNVPGGALVSPAVSAFSPTNASGLRQTYTLSFTDNNGWQDIAVANLLINGAINGVGACYLAFAPTGAATGTLYLVDNAGDAGGPYASGSLPGSGPVLNSQCSIDASRSAVTASGNTLTLTLAVTFSLSFAGNQVIYAAVRSNSQNSGWQAVGTVGVRDTIAPAISAVDPASIGAGSPALTITVTGGPFSVPAPCAAVCGFPCPGASVMAFDFTDIPTQYVNATQLKGVIPASLLSAPRTASVTVSNPILIECQGTESHVSAPASFVIVP